MLKNYVPRNRKWQMDMDYLDRLNEIERGWMNQFVAEFYLGQVWIGDTTALHNTDRLRRDCYSRANAARRDLFGIIQMLDSMENILE